MTEGAGEYEDVTPSTLCRWVVHVRQVSYERLASPPRDTTEVYDLDHPEGWPKWPDGWEKPEFQDRLRNGLENNDFSSVKAKDLPVAVGHIVAAAEKSPEELLAEAVGFSILGHNAELLREQLGRIEDEGLDVNLENLYPFHLAASYLDGAGTCCGVLEELMYAPGDILQKTYENRLGHTVLDNFMITILKSHTYITRGMLRILGKMRKTLSESGLTFVAGGIRIQRVSAGGSNEASQRYQKAGNTNFVILPSKLYVIAFVCFLGSASRG